MKDNSNQPPKDPTANPIITEDEFRGIVKGAYNLMIDSLAQDKDPSYGHIEQQVKEETQRRLEDGEVFVDEQAIRNKLTAKYNEDLKRTQQDFLKMWQQSVDEEIEHTNYQITSNLDRPVLTDHIETQVDEIATENIKRRLEHRSQMARILQNSIMKDVQQAKERLQNESQSDKNQ